MDNKEHVWDGVRDKCPVCEKPRPSIDHPSFQWCVPCLVQRITNLEKENPKYVG